MNSISPELVEAAKQAQTYTDTERLNFIEGGGCISMQVEGDREFWVGSHFSNDIMCVHSSFRGVIDAMIAITKKLAN
jgi:hypothetical protein